MDLDATLVTAHSVKELASPTSKRGFGFHPLCAFLDHGAEGTGEPLQIVLRTGRAGSDTAADHMAVTRQALRQLSGIGPVSGRDVRCWYGSTGRRHPRLPGLADRAAVDLLCRVHPARPTRRPAGPDPGERVDPGLRRAR